MNQDEKLKIFELLIKEPIYAGRQRWTDPRNPGFGRRWTRRDLDLYLSMGGTFNQQAGPVKYFRI